MGDDEQTTGSRAKGSGATPEPHGDSLMVFDTSYLYYRAFFGVPTSLRARAATSA